MYKQIATIELMLRRTLIHWKLYSAMLNRFTNDERRVASKAL